MRRLLRLSALLLAALLLAACEPDEVPSYVGKWQYAGSDPDLGPGYAESYVEVDRRWIFTFYDAPSGQTFSGTSENLSHDGLTITMTVSNDSGTRSYVATMQYLKDDKMVVQTASVNGTPTVIRFTRVPGSF